MPDQHIGVDQHGRASGRLHARAIAAVAWGTQLTHRGLNIGEVLAVAPDAEGGIVAHKLCGRRGGFGFGLLFLFDAHSDQGVRCLGPLSAPGRGQVSHGHMLDHDGSHGASSFTAACVGRPCQARAQCTRQQVRACHALIRPRANLPYFTRCFSNFLASVRRCMPRRRAVSEILKPVAARVSWMCSHSRVLIEVVRSVSSTSASP